MSAAAPSSALGQCVVCGKESTTACSVCKRAGLDWMLFCSKEHQKLIWKVHKRFCGQNPFEWPILNQQEVEDAWERRNLPLFPYKSTTWIEALHGQHDGTPLTVDEGEVNLGPVAYWQTIFQLLSVSLKKPTQQNALVKTRASSLYTKLVPIAHLDDSASLTEAARLFSKHPIEFASAHLDQAEARPQADSILSSECRHRLVILYSILAVQLEAKFKSELDWRQASYVQHAISAVESSSGVEDSSEAQDVVSKTIQTALNAWV
ncbi:hypothetical protein JCM5350_008325 [Sporobolomyces pararoseus]